MLYIILIYIEYTTCIDHQLDIILNFTISFAFLWIFISFWVYMIAVDTVFNTYIYNIASHHRTKATFFKINNEIPSSIFTD